ncbi:acid phosphatase [Bombella pollinis]|uniref:Phosphatase PAP2 family protein n=1 Tax=Bombella pollinis TaxID=2967337 RepID=A0ABT3WQL7_9PROT|nr:phosphatase PAP2 family protein [Bombella pollinis]MCX5620445.1 phosphatase PAP2 family protein [Bombella pollinis]
MRFTPFVMVILAGLAGYAGFVAGHHRPSFTRSRLPPPPALGSRDAELDKQIYLTTRQLIGSARWQQAVEDAKLNDEGTVQAFVEVEQLHLSPVEKEALMQRLRVVQAMARRAMGGEKYIWQRRRPFIDYGGQSCVIDIQRFLTSWSYPSGHTVRAYALALALSKLYPEHRSAFLAKAHQFAESRVICGMHWASDIKAGEAFATRLMETVAP